jgi:hypothetical protein
MPDPHHVNIPPTNGGQVPGRDVNGRKLARALKTGTAHGFAAWLAYQLETGEVWLHHLSAKQARAITGATCATLAAERRRHRSTNGNGKRVSRVVFRNSLADTDVENIVAQVGTVRVQQALDRLSQSCVRTGMFDSHM